MYERTNYSRREILRLSAGSLLALGLWPGALRAAGNGQGGEFYFIVVNDLHYFDTHCGAWHQTVVEKMNSHVEKPAFCVIAGDLSEQGSPEQLGAANEIYKNLKFPFFPLIGNHDLGNGPLVFEKFFPKRLNYIFDFQGWQFVAFDSTDGMEAYHAFVHLSTMQWIGANLRTISKSKPTVILTHFPLGYGVPTRSENADGVLDLFRDYNLQAAFNGHWHGYTEKNFGKISLTTNRCCSWHRDNFDGTSEKGYFLCHAKDGQISRTFIQVPCAAKDGHIVTPSTDFER